MFGSFGLTEILILLGIVVLVFGAKRLPLIGRGLGQAIGNFVKEIKGPKGENSEALPKEKSPSDKNGN
jgi:sec-independent protein translocase protein TatA